MTDDDAGWGIFTEEGLEANTRVLTIPQSLCIHPDLCRVHIESIVASPVSQELVPQDFLILYLVLHKLYEGMDFAEIDASLLHKPYVRILPKTFGTPLEFYPSELSLLEGTSLYNNAQLQLQKTAKSAQRLRAWLVSALETSTDPARELLRSEAQNEKAWLAQCRWAHNVYTRYGIC
mgnify:CR=1 FL=1